MLQPWEESWTFPVYYKYMYVYIIPSPCATANMCHESTGGQTARVGSVKGRSDFALCCAVSSIVLSVRALSPPSPFSPSFFSYFPLSPPWTSTGRRPFPLIIVRRSRLCPSKKELPDSHQATLSPFQLQTPPTTSTKLLKRSSPNPIPNIPPSS